MSSLLQFNGEYSNKGVGLMGYLQEKVEGEILEAPSETFICKECKMPHSKIYQFFRKPKGMFGNWVVFRYNKLDHVPDLSTPITFSKSRGEKLPRDAKPLSEDYCSKYWHS
tara:strand:+ start:66413 stop:66745 length:333 start_codon:yes stop_codon:yes gene_type:complete